MATKVKLKVYRILPARTGKVSVFANNNEALFTEKIFSSDGKELTEAQAKKAKPGTFRKRRVRTGSRVMLHVEAAPDTYKVGDAITVTF